MFDYIIAVVFWFLASLAAVMVSSGFQDNIYIIMLIFSLIAATITVAYGKLFERMANMERSLEELKEMLKDTQNTEN